MYAVSTFGTKLCVQSTLPLWIGSSAASLEMASWYSMHGIFGAPAFQYFGFLFRT